MRRSARFLLFAGALSLLAGGCAPQENQTEKEQQEILTEEQFVEDRYDQVETADEADFAVVVEYNTPIINNGFHESYFKRHRARLVETPEGLLPEEGLNEGTSNLMICDDGLDGYCHTSCNRSHPGEQ